MSCRHCHVGAGPNRTDAVMDEQTMHACLRAIDQTGARTVDLTGGAPELNPPFRTLVDALPDPGEYLGILEPPGTLEIHGIEDQKVYEASGISNSWIKLRIFINKRMKFTVRLEFMVS